MLYAWVCVDLYRCTLIPTHFPPVHSRVVYIGGVETFLNVPVYIYFQRTSVISYVSIVQLSYLGNLLLIQPFLCCFLFYVPLFVSFPIMSLTVPFFFSWYRIHCRVAYAFNCYLLMSPLIWTISQFSSFMQLTIWKNTAIL